MMTHTNRNWTRPDMLNRRSCLAQLAVALVAGSRVSNARAALPDAPPINVALITEPSAHHRANYLTALATADGVQSVGVADPTGQTLDEAKRHLGDRLHRDGLFTEVSRMLEVVRPALTVVTMEGHRAPAAVTTALRAGSHVLCEKPGCTELGQFEQLARLAEQQQRQVMLAMATRSSRAIKKARQLIAEGVLGKPYSASLLWIADQTRLQDPAYHRSWVADPARAGGGKLIYHGIHYLDICQHLLGEPIREINGFTHNVGGEPIKVEDSAVVSFRFASGAMGTLNTGYYLDRGKQTEIRIWGSQGWLKLELNDRRPLTWYSTKSGEPREIQQFDYADEPQLYDAFVQDAIHSVRHHMPPPITTAESLQVLRVVFAGYRAVETGQTQSLARSSSAPESLRVP